MPSMPQPTRRRHPRWGHSQGRPRCGVDHDHRSHAGHPQLPDDAGGLPATSVLGTLLGHLQRAGVECTGSYGAALTRYLHREGVTVTEVNQVDKATRRRRGKTDAIDAAAAAQAVLTGRVTVAAKTSDGPVETIRM